MDRRGILAAGASIVGGSVASLALAAKRTPSPRTSVAGQFIETHDGTALFYQDFGAGKPVVFVAPWALGCDWWEYEMAALVGRGMRCIAYDRRGQDRSTQPARGYDFDTLADDLSAVLDTLDLREVTLVGHSMGAAETVRYLSRHGSARVARLVLVAPITPQVVKTAGNPDGIDPQILEKGRATLAKDRAGAIGRAAPAFFGAPTNTVSPELTQWWVQLMLRCPLPLMLELHRSFTETDFAPDLPRISVPTLVVHGDKDVSALIDLTGRRTAQAIRDARLVVYDGAAHGLPITHMERLNEEIFRFASV
jgi:pimeloyl-ACP methyl ester carboxylesterase